jgi:hypothetical protein
LFFILQIHVFQGNIVIETTIAEVVIIEQSGSEQNRVGHGDHTCIFNLHIRCIFVIKVFRLHAIDVASRDDEVYRCKRVIELLEGDVKGDVFSGQNLIDEFDEGGGRYSSIVHDKIGQGFTNGVKVEEVGYTKVRQNLVELYKVIVYDNTKGGKGPYATSANGLEIGEGYFLFREVLHDTDVGIGLDTTSFER